VADYVLQPFKPHEQTLLAEKEEEIFAIIKDFIQ
jgi:peptidyl-tRNA hydrolase